MLGTIGAQQRMDTTVISDAVNLAARVENLTKTYRVPLIITGDTRDALQDAASLSLRRIDRVLVEGKSQPADLYEVVEAESSEGRHAKERSGVDFELGLAAYEALDFERAVKHFERALAITETDSVAALLLERARRLSAEPVASTAEVVTRVAKA